LDFGFWILDLDRIILGTRCVIALVWFLVPRPFVGGAATVPLLILSAGAEVKHHLQERRAVGGGIGVAIGHGAHAAYSSMMAGRTSMLRRRPS
jgi:hypothetical protein